VSKLTVDPELTPVETIAGEAALPKERLVAEWLRLRFANPPSWTPERTEEHLMGMHSTEMTPAAVLLPIVMRTNEPTLLLTQRTAHLTDHGGQISLPGGRVETSDASIIGTALREAEEEIGLVRSKVEVLGSLPDYFTVTGYRVTPVVSIVHPPFDLKADPFEVAEIFEVPLSFLMNGKNHQRRVAELVNGVGRRHFYAMPYERFFIWGATAGMLRNLFHFLRA